MKRRGYILVFVLGVTSVVTALGLSYVSANGTVMTQATNRYAAVRAQYLAESGIALAGHFIQYPPTTVPLNGLYPGATGVAIDDTLDTVDMTVTASSPADRYILDARSTVRNSLGTSALAKQQVRSEVIIPPEPKWKIAQALLSSGAVTVPSGVTITGNLHSNASVNGPLLGGNCTGSVSACLTALWLAGGPPTSVLSLQPSVTLPPASAALYSTYRIKGQSYAAYAGFAKNAISESDSASLNSTLSSLSNNPGRIVILPSSTIRLQNKVNFTGMLVVRGDLEIDGDQIVLQAVSNYPALLVTGSIFFKSNSKVMTVNGSVICGGAITDDGRDSCVLTVKGAAIVASGISRTGKSAMSFVHDASLATFWNLAKTATPEPITVLKWQEN